GPGAAVEPDGAQRQRLRRAGQPLAGDGQLHLPRQRRDHRPAHPAEPGLMAISEREAAHRAASDAERVAWVDEQDRPLGAVSRAELRERGLIGRGTYILLFNSAGQLCVHRRTLSKALYPGYWDVAAGGMVLADESYAESAARELAEELGIVDAELTEHAHFLYDAAESRLWCRAY